MVIISVLSSELKTAGVYYVLHLKTGMIKPHIRVPSCCSIDGITGVGYAPML
jgi:hypothetical protein